MNRVFAIASSTGGTQALSTIIPSLREDFPASVLVVQHMPESFTKSLSERLNWQSRITVVEAQNNMEIAPATVIIAKGGQHMKITGDEKRAVVVLSDEPSVMGLKPCANIMMESTARIFKSKVVGIILTGMGKDGTKGAEAIKLSGGTVITEDEDSCIVYGMPRSVVEANLSDKTVTLHELAHQMEQMV
jgi:two-component system chemotaxis response regulator CheB